MTLEVFKPMQMGAVSSLRHPGLNQGTEKPETLPNKPVSQREDAITQGKVLSKRASLCCPSLYWC